MMQNAKALLVAQFVLLMLFPAVALHVPAPSSVGGVPQRASPISVRKGVSLLKKSITPLSELKREMSIDEAIDRVITFRQYVLVGMKWAVEFVAVMAGVFSTQTNFRNKHESILGSFGVQRAAAVVGICNSCFFGGQAAGVFMAGTIGDTLGRRSAILTSSAVISAFSFLTAFTQSPLSFSLMRLCTGFGVGLGSSNCYLLATEFVSSQHSGIAGIGLAGFASLGMLVVAPIAYLLGDWRKLMLVSALLNLYLLLLAPSVLESPRWLLAKGRKDEARAAILSAVSAVRSLGAEDEAMVLRAPEPSSGRSKPQAEDLGQGLRHPEFRARLGVLGGCWFVAGLVFYGLACSVGSVPGNAHANQALFALADLLAIPLQLLLVSKLSRRPSMALVSAVGAAGLLSSLSAGGAQAQASAGLGAALASGRARLFVAKMAATTLFALLYIYASELFPTSIRASAVALCSLSARIASILAPLLISFLNAPPALVPLCATHSPASGFLAHSSLAHSPGPASSLAPSSRASAALRFLFSSSSENATLYSIFSAALLAAGAAAVVFLPETKGIGLPQTLEDLRKSA